MDKIHVIAYTEPQFERFIYLHRLNRRIVSRAMRSENLLGASGALVMLPIFGKHHSFHDLEETLQYFQRNPENRVFALSEAWFEDSSLWSKALTEVLESAFV